MAGTSNVHNTGIMHWVPTFGARPACGTHRAIMSTTGENFANEPDPCKKCKAKYDAAIAKEAAKVKPFTIDMTPSWAGVLPIYLMALQDGSAEAQRGAREELARMAKLADAYVAAQKAGQVA